MNTEMNAADPDTIRLLRYQCAKGVFANRSPTLDSDTPPVGTSAVELSVPCGLSAAEITNTIGTSANTTARISTTCRHQSPALRFRPRTGDTVLTGRPPPGCG